MCGIVGGIAERDITEILLTGLQRLEYRGYDSAGLAVVSSEGEFNRVRVSGKVGELVDAITKRPVIGSCGIGHTRWATHGIPHERNAHPQMSSSQVAIVHNGIIENFENLRERLKADGYVFHSETDTEVIAHLFHHHFANSGQLIRAARATAAELEGAFALGIIHLQAPDQLLAIRKGSPLVIGLGIGENFIASDQFALLPVTQRFIHLQDLDVALVSKKSIEIFDMNNNRVERDIHESSLSGDASDKGGYRHYMLKEIMEQPNAFRATLDGRLHQDQIFIESLDQKAQDILQQVKRIHIVACGTSYHDGLVAQYWIESMLGLPVRTFIASEYRYRSVPVEDNTLFISISQSGETADTLAALQLAKDQNYLMTLAVCNVPESAIIRASDYAILTRAGTEIGVASTKAFTTQLTVLLLLTGLLLQLKDKQDQLIELVQALRELPGSSEHFLELDKQIDALSVKFSDKQNALYIARGVHFPIVLEGALKLKELSYIHAEAYPAGELKHGPLALIDSEMPVIALLANDDLIEKVKSNIQEVQARGGEIYLFADNTIQFSENNMNIIRMPAVSSIIAPILYTIPLQLLSYHIAVHKGTDVDQPRNLAKSVTVE